MITAIQEQCHRLGGMKLLIALVAVCLVGFSLKDPIRRSGGANLHTHQANAFVHGQLHIMEHEDYVHDLAKHDGLNYSVFPPFPAILLAPFVSVLGMDKTNPVLLCVALTILNIVVLWRILGLVDVDPKGRAWWVAAFFLGTAYWFCLANSHEIYFYAHIVAVTCLLLAAHEALGKGRAYLVGFCLGAAFLSRQLSLYSFIFASAALWCPAVKRSWQRRIADLATLSLSFGSCVIIYCLFNYVRFGNMLDTGYQYMPLQSFLAARVAEHGVFSLAYAPFNFIHMFVQGFHVSFIGRELLVPQLDRFGTSLTMASPFIFLALWSKGPRLILAAAWCTVGLTIAHQLFYYNNGFVQFNAQRFTLDFMPVLIILIAVGAKRCSIPLVKGLIVYAVVLNVITLVGIPVVNACLLK
jgi:hypothetical protein